MSVRFEPTRALCSGLLSLYLYLVLVWNQYACVSHAKPAVERTNIEIFAIDTVHRVQGCTPTCERAGKHVLVDQRSGQNEVQHRCICLSGESNGICAVCLFPRPCLLRTVRLP